MKFKERIKEWLLSEETDKYNNATKMIESAKTVYNQALYLANDAQSQNINAERNYRNAQNYITELFDVGTDVHM